MSEDLLEVVVDRRSLLSRLDDGPVGKPALVEALGVSRSTVDRAVRELVRHDLATVARTDDGGRAYRTTLGGSVALECIDRFVAGIDSVAEAATLLSHCDPSAPCVPEFLVEGEVTRATSPAPVRALDEVTSALSAAERFRGFARSEPRSELTTILLERCLAGELSAELVVEDDLLDHVVGEHTAAIESAVRSGQLRIHTRTSLPYGLAVKDPCDPAAGFAAIVVDDGPDLRGVVASHAPGAVAWADDLVDRYAADAVELATDD